jgi:hypothetical protein
VNPQDVTDDREPVIKNRYTACDGRWRPSKLENFTCNAQKVRKRYSLSSHERMVRREQKQKDGLCGVDHIQPSEIEVSFLVCSWSTIRWTMRLTSLLVHYFLRQFFYSVERDLVI